jgi:hypothetical protein
MTTNKDDWTILRQNLRSVAEMIGNLEEGRVLTGLDAFFCPMLEFLGGCPDETIADTIRATTFLLVHPKWGVQWCIHLILHTGVNMHWMSTGIIQRNAVDALLTLNEQDVVRTLQILLRKSKLKFESWDAINDIVQWLLVHEPDAAAYLSQPDVIRHIPTDVAIADGVYGHNSGIKKMKAYGDGALELNLDLTAMREIALKGNTAAWRWMKEQSKQGDQTKFSDIDATIAWKAIKHVAEKSGLDCSAYSDADPATALQNIMEDLYSQHCADPEAGEECKYVASLAAFMISDYHLHDCAPRAFDIHHTVNKLYGLPHQAPDVAPLPRAEGAQ